MPVKWQEPKKPVWHARLEPLKSRPGVWGNVYQTTKPEQAHKYAWRLKNQRERFNLPEGHWEFKSEEQKDKSGAILARYMGEEA